MNRTIQVIQPGTFEGENHWYPKALNATIHPMVSFFLNLDTKRIINRYCHLNPKVDREKLTEILRCMVRKAAYLLWGTVVKLLEMSR